MVTLYSAMYSAFIFKTIVQQAMIGFSRILAEVTHFFKTISLIINSSVLFMQGQIQQRFRNKDGKIIVMLESPIDIAYQYTQSPTIIS